MRVFGFLCNHGVEVRHFLLSGLVHSIRSQAAVKMILRAETDSPALNEYLDFFKMPRAVMPFETKIARRHKNEHYLSKIRKARKKRLGIGNYHNFRNENEALTAQDHFLGNPLSFQLGHSLWAGTLKTHYTHQAFIDFYKSEGFTDLVLLDYNSPFQLMAGFSANAAGVKVHIVMNTLKTYYTNDYVPFEFQRLYAWDQEQTQLFQQSNPQHAAHHFVNGGNPYYTFFTNNQFQDRLPELYQRYPQLLGQKLIVYSLIYEKMYAHEFELLQQLNQVINDTFLPEDRPIVVVRRNPFEESTALIRQIETLDNFFVSGHYWERDVDKEWSIQSIEGEKEWKWLLSQASLCMNIPSMAGYESLLSGTPVLNIGFGPDGQPSAELKQFTDAPFMKSFNRSKFIRVCYSIEELNQLLPEWIDLKAKNSLNDIRHSIDFTLFEPQTFAH